jgi:hypothetical protein
MLQDNEFGRCHITTRRIDLAVLEGDFFDTSLKFENDIGTSTFKAWDQKRLHLCIRNGNVEGEHSVSSREDLTVHVPTQGPDHSSIRETSQQTFHEIE